MEWEKETREKETRRRLFGGEIDNVAEDRFEGSKEEGWIFTEILYGKRADFASNLQSNGEGSALTLKDSEMNGDGSEDSSGVCRQVQVAYRVIETSGRNIISSQYFTSVSVSPKLESRNQEEEDAKALVPVESDTSLGSTVLEEIRRALVNQRGKEYKLLCSDSVDIGRKLDFTRELPKRLRSHASRLLIDVGWKLETRKRRNYNAVDYIYVSPEGRFLNSLTRAWLACGEWLHGNSSSSEYDGIGRQWFNIQEFWVELTDTLVYIEKDIQDQGNRLSHLLRWQLLDPFVAVVCIDQMITFLKQRGKPLRAVNSTASIIRRRATNMIVESEGMGGVIEDCILETNLCSMGNLTQKLLPAPETDGKSEVVEKCGSQEQDKPKAHSNPYEHRKSLKSLARRIGKELCDSKNLNDTKCKASKRKPGRKRKVSDSGTSIEKTSSINVTVGTPSDVVFPQEATTPADAISESYARRSSEASWSNKLVDCTVQESGAASVPDEELPCKIMRMEYPTGKRASEDKDGEYNEGVLAQIDYLNSPSKAVYQSESLDSSTITRGDSIRKVLRFDESDDNANAEVEEEKSNEVSQQNTILPGDAYNLFLVNPTFVHPLQEQQVLYLYPAEQAMYLGVGSNCRQELIGYVNIPDGIHGSNMQQGVTTQPGLMRSLLVYGINNTNFPIQQEEIHSVPLEDQVAAATSSKKSKSRKQKTDGTEKGSKSRRKPNSEEKPVSTSTRKSHKRSKKISEIESTKVNVANLEANLSTEVNAQNLEAANLSNASCKEAFSHEIDGRNDCQEESIKMNIEEQSDRALTMEKEQPSTVPEASSSKKRHKRPAKRAANLEIKQGNQNSEDKKGIIPIPSNDESGSTSLNYGREQEDISLASVDYEIHLQSTCENSYDENLVLVKSESCPNKFGVCKRKRQKKQLSCRIYDDDDPLASAIIRSKDYRKCKYRRETSKTKKDKKKINLRERTVLCWLIEMGAISLSDILQYRNSKGYSALKTGLVREGGILCLCCKKMFSVSEFMFHAGAGFKMPNPSFNLYLNSGETYTLRQLSAWSAEYKARKSVMPVMGIHEDQNDDSCARCGDGGELVCCDSCPSSYHRACLPSQDLPEGNWYCPHCTCDVCGGTINTIEPSSYMVSFTCLQCEHKYHQTCLKGVILCEGEIGSTSWFCGESCQEVYAGLHSRIGEMNCIGDGFCWTILRCNHGDQKILSAQKIAFMAECHTKLAVALTIMEECFVPMVDPRTGINMIPHVLYNWGIKDFTWLPNLNSRCNLTRLNYQGFYTIVLEKGDELISVASVRVHGVTVAELPLIATCTEHRRRGMCTLLMGAIEDLLKSLRIKMLVLSAIPDLVDTWISGFGYEHIGDDEKKQLSKISLMSFPGTVLLKKSLYQGTVEKEDDISSNPDNEPKSSIPSSDFPSPKPGNIEHGDFINEESCSRTKTSQLSSTEQALLTHMPTVKVSSTGCREVDSEFPFDTNPDGSHSPTNISTVDSASERGKIEKPFDQCKSDDSGHTNSFKPSEEVCGSKDISSEVGA